MESAISTINLSKNYGNVHALSDVNIEVKPHELFGLIGPDGSGKTSLFRLLATLLIPDNGSASIMGLNTVSDYKAIRKILGYMPGRFSLYGDMTVQENLKFYASVFSTTIDENYDLISDIFKMLEPFKDRRAAKLSGGMKQKLALCCALIHKPQVLLLDEPTTGVDPVSRREFWDVLHRLLDNGITIMVSTPYMDEAAQCNRVALIDNGKILKVDSPRNIVNNFNEKVWSITGASMYSILLNTREYSQVLKCYPFGETHHIIFRTPDPDINAFIDFLKLKGEQNIIIKPINATIEDCYMNISQ